MAGLDIAPPPSHAPEFPYFSRLPLELRLRIWKHVACQSRYVDIWADHVAEINQWMNAVHDTEQRIECYRFTTLQPVPAILHISREARAVGLKHYTLEFGSEYTLRHGLRMINPPRIYANLDIDMICPLAMLSHSRSALSTFMGCKTRNIALNIAERSFDENSDTYINVMSDAMDWVDFHREIVLYYLDPPHEKPSRVFYDTLDIKFVSLGGDASHVHQVAESELYNAEGDLLEIIESHHEFLDYEAHTQQLDELEQDMWSKERTEGEARPEVMKRERPEVSIMLIVENGKVQMGD